MELKKLVVFLFAVLVIIVPVLALDSPAQFSAASVPGEKVSLTWQKVANAVGYNLYRKIGNDTRFEKINSVLIKQPAYDDRQVSSGMSYEYYATAIDAEGVESIRSNAASAPNLVMAADALVTHPGGKPVMVKSIKTKKMVSVAVPGDIISYIIKIGNNGYGRAMNALLTYPIPEGTRLIPTSVDTDNFKTNVSFFDKQSGKWTTKINNDKHISSIRFKILDPITPLTRGYNGQISFQVLIET